MKTWISLLRPWSLTASAVPFVVALPVCMRSARGWDGSSPLRWCIALAAALLLQTACNLLNTWGDWKSGLDSRPGAKASVPVLVEGKASPRAVLAAALAALAGSAALAAPLLAACGSPAGFNAPLAAAAAAGFAGAANYATLLRFKYAGLGTPFVFFLMGPVFFVGVYSAAVDPDAACSMPAMAGVAALSLPTACHVAAILHGNDMRDRKSDAAAGVRTLASRFGARGALAAYALLMAAPFAAAAAAAAAFREPALLLPLLALPPAARAVRRAFREFRASRGDPEWRGFEREAGKTHFLFGVLEAAALFAACGFCERLVGR